MTQQELIDKIGDAVEHIVKRWSVPDVPPRHDCATCRRRHGCPDWNVKAFEDDSKCNRFFECNRYVPSDWVKGGAA